MSRMFGLFQRRFLVPWDEITADPKTVLLMPMARLTLGHPDIASLTVDAANWQRLSAHSPAKARRVDRFEPVSRGQVAQALVLQLAIISAGVVFFSPLRRGHHQPSAVIHAIAVAITLIIFGVIQFIRYIKMRF
jgi:hypothetical protein